MTRDFRTSDRAIMPLPLPPAADAMEASELDLVDDELDAEVVMLEAKLEALREEGLSLRVQMAEAQDRARRL